MATSCLVLSGHWNGLPAILPLVCVPWQEIGDSSVCGDRDSIS